MAFGRLRVRWRCGWDEKGAPRSPVAAGWRWAIGPRGARGRQGASIVLIFEQPLSKDHCCAYLRPRHDLRLSRHGRSRIAPSWNSFRPVNDVGFGARSCALWGTARRVFSSPSSRQRAGTYPGAENAAKSAPGRTARPRRCALRRHGTRSGPRPRQQSSQQRCVHRGHSRRPFPRPPSAHTASQRLCESPQG